jgi:DNA-binding NtrC family response regulator
VDEGKFREDLFFRLNVVVIDLPPLRERAGDIPILAQQFIRHFSEENNKKIDGLTTDAMEVLAAHSWPGNVRELRNVIERMVVMSRGDKLTVRDIPQPIRESTRPGGAGASARGGLSIEEAEKSLISRALRAHDGSRTLAARDLGISRRTLHRKLNEFGLRDS